MKPICSLFVHSLAVCAILSTSACAVRADAGTDPAVHDASVTLQRSTCFGNCPAYTVTMAADGQIRFVGHSHVQTGAASDRATPTRRANIFAALKQAGFDAMQPSYVSHDDGCETVMTDQPGIKITVTGSAGSKTVDFYLGCTGAVADAVRPRIRQLADSIDRQLDTARWIGKPAAPGAVDKPER
ncbi:DUF6438 domain-containing protein [Rhodanobacter sp. Col0626]|uniref:DUF6438 domain-containing protein n=1 Tax=Rhodanobacter sp. Col0626 TaxID=3415679 RepID=UPI003CFB3C69